MLILIYGPPTAGKSYAIEQIFEEMAGDAFITDTDDIMYAISGGLNHLGYRKWDNELFWQFFQDNPQYKKILLSLVEGSLRTLQEADHLYVVFTNLIELQSDFHFDLTFSRTVDDLSFEYRRRELTEHFGMHYTEPEWIKNYKSPEGSICLPKGSYISDYLDDIRALVIYKMKEMES